MGRRTNPSLKVNMVLNIIKSVMGVLFPLITFPYISRLLGVENIGRFTFAQSVVSYFVLLAGLGVSTYAIREAPVIRDDQEKMSRFSSEVFSINLVATVFSYLLMLVLLVIVPKFNDYSILILILSLQIIFKTIGLEWIFSVYEDFLFTTVRSILFQVISLAVLFLFVRQPGDLYLYTAIVVLTSAGAEIVNCVYVRRYCHISFKWHQNLKKHMRPILTLFAMAAAVMIYVSIDITMLGFLCDDFTVGIYSVSVKVYTVLKTVASAALIVFIPRISLHIERRQTEQVNAVASEAHNTMVTILLPVAVGVFVLREEAIAFLAGAEYSEAVMSLAILCGSLVFCLLAGYWSQVILIPFREEKSVLIATIISAIANLVLNLLLIPLWQEKAAALTTLLSEMIAFIYCYTCAKDKIQLNQAKETLLKVIIGCSAIVVIDYLVSLLSLSMILRTIIVISCSMITYFGIEVILKNDAVISICKSVYARIRKR